MRDLMHAPPHRSYRNWIWWRRPVCGMHGLSACIPALKDQLVHTRVEGTTPVGPDRLQTSMRDHTLGRAFGRR